MCSGLLNGESMALLHVPDCKTYIDLRRAADKKVYNLERVRSYVEKNPGCLNKQIIYDLKLHPRTVAKYLKRIREQGCC